MKKFGAIKYYKENIDKINQLLVVDSREDIMLLNDEQDDELKINYSRENVIKYLEIIKTVYKVAIISYMSKNRRKDWKFSYITQLSNIQKFKNEPYIDKFLLIKHKQNFENINLSNNQIIVDICGDEHIPYIELNDIFNNNENEILISLFTEVKSVIPKEPQNLENQAITSYEVKLEMQELQDMSNDDKIQLYNYIISNSDLINTTLINSANLEKENSLNYEQIRNLEKQISDLEIEINNNETNHDNDILGRNNTSLEKLRENLEILKNRSAEIFDSIKNNNKTITDWKKSITVYLMSECLSLRESIIQKMNEENELEIEKVKAYEIKERVKKENLAEEEFEKIYEEVQEECTDNEILVKRLLGDINKLINRQQCFAKIAGSVGSSYSALNNAFEMKKNAEELEDLVNEIKLKAQSIFKDGDNLQNSKLLLKISEVNNQIMILINYLNNSKTVDIKQKINRFDEMIVVEENELKRDIAKTILDVRGEAELKKLRDDTQIIEEKSFISKICGIFTGQNKLDDFMLEQIEIREKSIKKTLSRKLRLDYNYSIHELVAEIRIFIKENEDDELVAEDIIVLKDIENEIKKSFVIIESKVKDIIDEKENKNLPISNKVSKKDLIEIETFRFLSKYGYNTEDKKEEAVYTDTTAKEIARISEYINTSGILK